MRYVLDTNILLHYLRESALAIRLEQALLLTTDLDFEHLNHEFLLLELIK